MEGLEFQVVDEILEWVDEDGTGSRVRLDAEMELLRSLPPAKRELVVDRLLKFQRHRREIGDMRQLADDIGTGRSNLYRLIKRMRQVGPVRGLATQHRDPPASSTRVGGFGEPVDGWIAAALAEAPDASLSQVRALLEARSAGKAADEVALPGRTALRRRLLELRRQPVPTAHTTGIVGDGLLLDQVRLDAFVADGADGAARPLSCMAVVDLDTRFVCGGAVFVDDERAALFEVAADFRSRMAASAAAGLRVGERLMDLKWTVPDALVPTWSMVGGLLPADRRPTVHASVQGERRFGEALLRTIGDRVGPYAMVLRGASTTADGRRTVPEGGDEAAFGDMDEARAAVRRELDLWNERVSVTLPRVGGRGRTRMAALAGTLADDFDRLFEGVAGSLDRL